MTLRSKIQRSQFDILVDRKFKKMQDRDAARLKKAGILIARAAVLPFTLAELTKWLIGRSDLCAGAAWQCLYCKAWVVIEELELDHFHPLSRGGATTLDNLACCCHRCNQIKTELTGTEFCELMEFAGLNFVPAAVQILRLALQASGQAKRMRAERARSRR